MAGTTRLDAEAARGKAEKLRAIHGEYVNLLSTLHSSLQQHEKCWGSDSFGKAFEKGYTESLATYRGNADIVGSNLEATAGNIDGAVDALQAQDEANAAAIS